MASIDTPYTPVSADSRPDGSRIDAHLSAARPAERYLSLCVLFAGVWRRDYVMAIKADLYSRGFNLIPGRRPRLERGRRRTSEARAQ